MKSAIRAIAEAKKAGVSNHGCWFIRPMASPLDARDAAP